jgi:hypothetical protein
MLFDPVVKPSQAGGCVRKRENNPLVNNPSWRMMGMPSLDRGARAMESRESTRPSKTKTDMDFE